MNSDSNIKLSKGETTRDVELRRVKARSNAELFKAVATFGAFAVAVFGLGGPVILALAEGLDRCFRQWMIALAGVAAFLIAAYILCFYRRLARHVDDERASSEVPRQAASAQQAEQTGAEPEEDAHD